MKVTSVRKDKKGCKVGDNWYMFSPAVEKYVADKELYGADVDIETSTDGKLINKITIKTAPIQEKGDEKAEYWQRRETREIENSKRISRHGALNTAIEILKTSNLIVPKEIPPGDILANAETIAEEVLKFVNKNI